jgi:hypothetical protein
MLRALALVAVLVTAGAYATNASGLESPPPITGNMYADDRMVEREMKRQFKERDEREAKRETDAAKADRKASRTRYKDKSDHEALAIARGKFERFLDVPTFTGLTLRPGEKVKQYVDDFQALIQVGDDTDEVALVESDLPLRNDAGEPTDLELEAEGDGFTPKAATVELDLPGDLTEGIGVAGGQLRIKPVTDGETEAAETADKVFYGNAQTDTDVLVKPTARGFETFTQLRSAESPEQVAFDVEVPGGATLRQTDAPGAAQTAEAPIEVVSPGGKRIATISPPRAVAADGEEVDVSYALDGMRVTMSVAHRDRDVAYPILVDPDYIYEDWLNPPWATTNRDQYGWTTNSWGNCGWVGYFGQGSWTYGRAVAHGSGNYCEVDNWAQWIFQAPRASYIYRAEFHYQNHQNRFTCLVNGLWDPWRNNWDAGWVWVHCGDAWNHSRGHCPISNDCNWDYGSPTNIAVFKVQICCGNGNRSPGARAELGGSLIYMRDRENPVIDATNHNTDSRWYRSGTMTVSPRAHDDGLGMNKFQLYIPGFVDDYRRHPCIRSRCPHYWQLPADGQGIFSYNIPDIPNGINSVTLNARDALDKITGSNWSINVDDEVPYLNVYGPLRDAVYAGTWSGMKTLSIQSHDNRTTYTGANSTARSGITAVDVYIDGVKKHSQTQSCFANCRLDFNWTFEAERYPSGMHSIRVVARDGAGNEFSSSTWKVSTVNTSMGTEDKGDPVLEDGAPVAGTEQDDVCVQDPAQPVQQTCSNSSLENAAMDESSLAPNDSFGLPKIQVGSKNWGYADQGAFGYSPDPAPPNPIEELDANHPVTSERSHFDDPRFKRLRAKRLRVNIPWDVIQRLNGDGSGEPGKKQSTYSFYEKDPAYPNGKLVSALVDPDESYMKSRLRDFDRYMTKVKELMDLPVGDPNRVEDVIIAIYSTELSITHNGVTGFKLTPRVLPEAKTRYINNVKQIITRYRSAPWSLPPDRMKYIEAFNEPNHPAYAPHGELSFPQYWNAANPSRAFQSGAMRAADYYDELRSWCVDGGGNCVAVAGSFVDRDELIHPKVSGEKSYFDWYKHYLYKKYPPVWAYHPYNAGTEIRPDVKPGEAQKPDKPMTDRRLRDFLALTKPKTGQKASSVFFTEVGPLYAGTNGNQKAPDCKGRVGDDLRACQWNAGTRQLDFLMKLPNVSTRIKRFYYYAFEGVPIYDWNNVADRGHDSGMLDPLRGRILRLPAGSENPTEWAFEYSLARQIRPAYCRYGAATDPPFQFAKDGETIRACPYTAVKDDGL